MQASHWEGEGVRRGPSLFDGKGVGTEPHLHGEGVRTAGSGERETGSFARDYYDLALSDGGVYRIYCDLRSAQWFVDGMYD